MQQFVQFFLLTFKQHFNLRVYTGSYNAEKIQLQPKME